MVYVFFLQALRRGNYRCMVYSKMCGAFINSFHIIDVLAELDGNNIDRLYNGLALLVDLHVSLTP